MIICIWNRLSTFETPEVMNTFATYNKGRKNKRGRERKEVVKKDGPDSPKIGGLWKKFAFHIAPPQTFFLVHDLLL